ncbi:MAG: Clp protease N-terminal domain-containing protein [Planctomycetota bacterium]
MTTKDLSPRALEALERAKELAHEEGSPCCSTGHLIFGLTADHLSLGNRIFDDVNIYPEMFRDHLKKLPPETDAGDDEGLHPLTVLALKRGRDARKKLGDSKVVTTDHVMLGLLSIQEGSAYECLREFSVEPDEIAKELIEALGFEIEARPTW